MSKQSHLRLVPDLPVEPIVEPAAPPEPVIDGRAIDYIECMPHMEKLRLFTALQALSMPKGMRLTRHFSRTDCARIVTEMTGITVSGRSKARPPKGSLEVMLTWLIQQAESKGVTIDILPQIIPVSERDNG